MAGRLYIPSLTTETLLPGLTVDAPLHSSPNLAPRQPLSIVRWETHNPHQVNAFWGFTPPWLKVLDHAQHCARAETLSSRPMFAEALDTQRCLVPVGGVYIWKSLPRMKQPFLVTRIDRGPLLLAGLWCRFPTTGHHYHDSMALITVASPPFLDPLSDRLPALMSPESAVDWLHPETSRQQVESMLHPPAGELLGAFPVSKRVNDPACQEWACAHPTGPMLCQHHTQER
ncbi:SOS response-associated peptidase [Aidingimonas lacisalsi]|uniref:SOS response-associated peptidase n=1 Tax=Aidingimonas lacisalsi TaxID=2604086 RepID=UPI0011D1E789|nr:SOS response-associated peptidase [Aidingimonas lacisalsi]